MHHYSRAGLAGAFATHSRNDSKRVTAKARRTFLESFEQQVDPAGELPLEERRRRARFALKKHMLALATTSAKARRQRSEAKR